MKAAPALALTALSALTPSAQGVTLFDHLIGSGFGYAAANGDTDGPFNGGHFGLQVGQLVTATSDGTVIDEVSTDYLTFGGIGGQAWVEVYDETGSVLISTTDGPVRTKATLFDDTVFGNTGVNLTATGLALGGLTPGARYLVVMQVDGLWHYACRDLNDVRESFGRDFSHHGYGGSYGTTAWTEFGDLGYGSGQANMRIKALPEPSCLLALAGLLLRRKRSR